MTEIANKAVQQFKIEGMDCAEEVAILKREIGPLVGGEQNLAFDILNARMQVATPLGAIDGNKIVQAVNRTGMRAELWRERDRAVTEREHDFWQRRGRTIMTVLSAVFTLAGFITHSIATGGIRAALGSEGAGIEHAVPVTAKLLYAAAVVTGSWYVVPKAYYALRRLRPDMNFLMTIAVIGAISINEWLEAASVSFLFSLSLALESWSVRRARRAVEALLDLAPPTVRVLREDGQEEEIAPEAAPIGTRFIIKPGERIPLDGLVDKGSSNVDQSPITGESVPVFKEPGTNVFAGTVNGDGALEVISTKLAGETTLAGIIRLVGSAQSKRAPAEQWVDRFARIYTPTILALAILTALIPPLLFSQPWNVWIYRSLVLLVIGCPCALVISTPVSIVAALASAARQGVLIKGGVYVETPGQIRAIALDKTGTLTEGKPTVVQVIPFDRYTDKELLEIALALEMRSDHPLANAIVSYGTERGISPAPAEDFQIVQGKGAWGQITGKLYWLGSHRYLEERQQETPEVHERIEQLSSAGKTVVVIGDETHVIGLILLADQVREDSKRAVAEIRRLGVENVTMLTGDNRATAEAIGRETGVTEIHAELLPADKVAQVERLVDRYGKVAMVGDGVNDAPALSRATMGISMGAVGSDAAIEASDVALMSDDISKLTWLIRHSRRASVIIRQNIFFSIAVKLVFMILTYVGHATLWGAISADMGVSLLVIFNALRLLKG